MSRRWVFLAVPALCVLASFAVHRPAPRYEGKTLAAWFEEPQDHWKGASSPYSKPFLERREEAVRFLTRVACRGPNFFSSRYSIVYDSLPNGAREVLPQGRSDGEYRDRQTRALGLLGVIAATALPSIAPQSLDEIQDCLRSCLRDSSWRVRAQAAQSAAQLGPHAAPLMPELLLLLEERNETVLVAAIEACGSVGPSASNALPKLSALHARAKPEDVQPLAQALSAITGTASDGWLKP